MTQRIFNYDMLRGRIAEKRMTLAILSKKVNISESSLCTKLTHGQSFKPEYIEDICFYLEISRDAIGQFFFAH